MEILEASKTKDFSRRKFLLGSATVAASAVALSTFGCAPGTSVSEGGGGGDIPNLADKEAGGTWINAACWHNCGGRCVNKVMVKDGVVVRQKTDDSHPDTPEYPQQRGCVRGKAQQQQCFGADRILYPLKRKGWQPGGGANSNGSMRGRDEWERISWDEAIQLATDEMKRISDELGPTGFYSRSADGLLNLTVGGSVAGWETSSMGTFSFATPTIGLPGNNNGKCNDRFDMQNADYIIMWSSNPTWSAAGTPTYYYIQAKEAGAKIITIDPMYSATAHMLDAEWVPVRCGADLALMLAIAYEMLRLEEEEGNIIDWDLLHRCTVGFDSESMPPDMSVNENLKDYILGVYDGIPKTPEWASPITGTPVEQITNLAHVLGKNNKVTILHNYAFVRTHGNDMTPQMIMALATMGGHIGKSGHACGASYHANCGNLGPRLVSAGSSELPDTPSNSVKFAIRNSIAYELIAQGGGQFDDVGSSGAGMHAPVPTTLAPVKCIVHNSGAGLQTRINQKAGIEAHRKVDFVLSRAQFMTTNARFADIVLPVTTEWERVGGVTNCGREFTYCWTQVTEPLGEAKTDQEIDILVAEAFGFEASVLYDKSEKQQFFEQIAGSKVMGDDGEMGTLVTITAADIEEMGVEGEPQEGIVSMADFIANGGYQFERSKGDGHGFIGYEDFVKDPEANPLTTSNSGKIEIYCQKRYSQLESQAPTGWKPYPTYVVPVRGYETTFVNGEIGGEKTEHPFLMYNLHYIRRSHSVFDNCPWMREGWPNPVIMNTDDGEALGISDGDTVVITSSNGNKSLRTAALIDFIMPGIVAYVHGAWTDVDESTGIDMAGSDNWLCPGEFAGFGVTAYNTQNIAVEKYSGAALVPDCELPPRFVSETA